jgi:hypothetical protein
MPSEPCTICADVEPHHVHDRAERIDDYFLIGRGQTDEEAARSWQTKHDGAQYVINEAATLVELGKFDAAHELLKEKKRAVPWRR